jgi:hypothetical protein
MHLQMMAVSDERSQQSDSESSSSISEPGTFKQIKILKKKTD